MTSEASSSLIDWILGTVRAPREVARAFAAAGHGAPVGWLMASIGLALTLVTNRLFALVNGEDVTARLIADMKKNFGDATATPENVGVVELAVFVLTSAATPFAAVALSAVVGGRMLGGRGEPASVFVIVGWWFLLYALAELVFLCLLAVAPPPLNQLVLLLYAMAVFYILFILVSMVAEAHGFEHMFMVFLGGVAMVVGVVVSLSVVFALVANIIGAIF